MIYGRMKYSCQYIYSKQIILNKYKNAIDSKSIKCYN